LGIRRSVDNDEDECVETVVACRIEAARTSATLQRAVLPRPIT